MLPRHLRAYAAVLVPTAALALHGLAYGRWIVDDAAITFAYARSITTGAGPVLQPGADPVEGYSNPAWLGLVAVGRLLGLFDSGAWFGVPDYVLFPKVLALLLAAGVFAAFHAAASALTSRPALVTIAAGTVTALVPSFAIWVFSGLENSLLAFAAVTLAAVLARAVVHDRLLRPRTAVVSGLLAALAAMTRPDGLIYAGAYALVVLVLLRRGTLRAAVGPVLLGLAAFAVPVGLSLLWRWVAFGALLPNTALAKAQGLPTAEDLTKPAEIAGYAGWLTLLVAVVLVGAALLRPSARRDGLLALVVPLGLAVAAYAVLAEDWMAQFRFATPVWPLAALTAAVAGAHVLGGLAVRGRIAVAVLGALGLAQSGTLWWQAMDTFRAAPTVPVCVIAQIDGWEFNSYARLLGVRDGSLLVPDIGGAALTSELEVIDLAGLAHRRIAEHWAADDMAGLRDFVFTEAEPTFITAHGAWARQTGILADPRLRADYELITRGRGDREKWVRRDAVPDPAALAAVRAAAVTAAGHWDAASAQPRGSCGPRLTPESPYRS